MRPVHNTPIPQDTEFPIPADCVCDGDATLCKPCQAVMDAALAEQAKDEEALMATPPEYPPDWDYAKRRVYRYFHKDTKEWLIEPRFMTTANLADWARTQTDWFFRSVTAQYDTKGLWTHKQTEVVRRAYQRWHTANAHIYCDFDTVSTVVYSNDVLGTYAIVHDRTCKVCGFKRQDYEKKNYSGD